MEFNYHVVPQPPLTRVQLTLVVLIEEQLEDMVEPFVFDTKAYWFLDHLEQSSNQLEPWTPPHIHHSCDGQKHLVFSKYRSPYHCPIHFQHTCLHLCRLAIINWVALSLWWISCWAIGHFLSMWYQIIGTQRVCPWLGHVLPSIIC